MINPSDRELAVELIQEANLNGARLTKACTELNISVRTYERWVSDGGIKENQRPHVRRPEPPKKLTKEESLADIKIVGWEVCEIEDAAYAEVLIKKHNK